MLDARWRFSAWPSDRSHDRPADRSTRAVLGPDRSWLAEPTPADGAPRSRVVRFGDVELDLDNRTVRRAGERLELAPRVLDLLVALVERAPRVVPRGELLRDVWGYDPTVVTRTVDTHVRSLRCAIEPDPACPRYIRTVVKFGYRFTP